LACLSGNDYLNLETDQLGRKRRADRVPLCKSVLDSDALAVDPAQPAQSLLKCLDQLPFYGRGLRQISYEVSPPLRIGWKDKSQNMAPEPGL
jgi:hypothetical protein